jgi:hypothetical protein
MTRIPRSQLLHLSLASLVLALAGFAIAAGFVVRL